MNSWIKEAIFYHIYPLGFCGAPHSNNHDGEPADRLEKVEKWIPHMKSIGINAIYMGPLFESGTHGYDTSDYYNVDRRLGSNEDLIRLCNKLHENDIKVILDGVFNHVGRDFWAFKDVLENGVNSKYCNWFSNLNFQGQSPYGDNFSYDSWRGFYNLVKLNLKNSELKDYLLGAVNLWIEKFHIDGLRLDTADCVDMDFLKELSKYCKAKREDFWLMGEVIHGDYNRWVNEDTLDSVTNYECYKGIYSSHNDKNYFEIAYSLNRQFGDGGIYKNLCLYNFVDNHDVNRIASTVNIQAYLNTVYTLLFTMPGVPSIYYGSEWGIYGKKDNNSDYALRPELDLQSLENNSGNKDIGELISRLSDIRKNSEALKYGAYKQVLVKNKQYVFARIADNETMIIALNLEENDISIELNMQVRCDYVIDLLNDSKKYEVSNGKLLMDIPAYSAQVLKMNTLSKNF